MGLANCRTDASLTGPARNGFFSQSHLERASRDAVPVAGTDETVDRQTPTSDGRAIKIVPKGLRSFDAHGAISRPSPQRLEAGHCSGEEESGS